MPDGEHRSGRIEGAATHPTAKHSMAFFKLRSQGNEARPAAAAPAESVEAMRRRARHRLIGAAVLVLIGVVGFPLLFDTQPRPIAVDIPIEIPDRNKVKPLPLPPTPPAPVAAAKVSPAPQAEAPEPARPAAMEQKPAETRVTSVEPKPAKAESEAPSPQRGEEEKPAKSDDGAKARALLDGKSLEAAAGGRFVVQVGAFAETDKARQAQLKLERAGFVNYTHVTETKDGKRIRVRAGPFASRAEADKAAEKIKGLDLPVQVLTL
jgi:DedD protein